MKANIPAFDLREMQRQIEGAVQAADLEKLAEAHAKDHKAMDERMAAQRDEITRCGRSSAG